MIQHPVELFMPADADLLDLAPLETFWQLNLRGFGKLLFSKGKEEVVDLWDPRHSPLLFFKLGPAL